MRGGRMSIDKADAPPPPPPPQPPPDYSAADVPVTDQGQPAPDSAPPAADAPVTDQGQPAPDSAPPAADTADSSADTATGVGSSAFDAMGDIAPADVPVVDEGQGAPDLLADASDAPTYSARAAEGVPVEHATLPDGRDAIVIGHPRECADNALGTQGNNSFGKRGDCGVVSCANVANEFDKKISEEQAVKYASDNGFLSNERGGTTVDNREQILNGLGVDSTQAPLNTLEDIARPIENGQGEIIRVNAGELWNRPNSPAYGEGTYNHAIQVTGVVRDAASGQIEGFYVNDSGRRDNAGTGQFVSAERMQRSAFPKDSEGNLIAGQNYANLTVNTWVGNRRGG
jgi:hypothetical protein